MAKQTVVRWCVVWCAVFAPGGAGAADVFRSPGNRTYYVDARVGKDANAGTTPAGAWKSLEKVNACVFAPGDRVLLKSGCVWRGRLVPRGSGVKGRPIVVDRYGGSVRPIINGGGAVQEAVLLSNQEYVEVRNLELTNTGARRQARRAGVRVRIDDFGTAHHVVLAGLYVHDVNGSLVKKAGGGAGIVWENRGRRKKSRFDGLRIENCHIVRTDRNGIVSHSGYWQRKDWYPSLHVVIRGNCLADIGGDGIVPIGCDGCLIDSNVVRGGRMRCADHAAGIWPWSCDNTVVQFNEVSRMRGTKDGQGFDSDWNCRNTLFQYNYSHDNDGGFMLICNNGGSKMPSNIGNTHTVIRYNISQNDATRTFHISGPCRDIHIYNNVFHVGPKLRIHAVLPGKWGGGWTRNCRFTNNIFHVDGEVKYEFGGMENVVFESNIFSGRGKHIHRPKDPSAVTVAAPLIAPGTGKDGRTTLGGYHLRLPVPAGKPVPNNGGRDFWGNKLPPRGRPSIGAHQPGR